MNNPEWEEIERALAAVMELPEEERAAYLAQQPASIRTEVESLLAAYRRSNNFLGDETGKAIGPGAQLGPYRIEAALGEGGMGVVYRALDTKLNRPVALKFLFEDLADAAARRRFQREARMASSLNHPHILTVHDVGDFEGRQYLVTEYVDGGTLKDWARAGKRSWREIVELLVGVADGLATAHTAGILHRDIKPANILVAKTGYAKLADFGLAKRTEVCRAEAGTPTVTVEQTRPGIIQGTIAYMSPEQASGLAVDGRSDIFSFGVVLYELLAGRRPFEGVTDLETLQRIIHGAAQPLGGEVPLPLRLVVEKALEKDPAERYQSMREMVVDLRRLSRESGQTPVPPAATHRYKWATAALIVLVLTAGIVFTLFRKQTGPVRLEYTQLTNFTDSATSPALSSDGRMLAFIRGPETFYGRGEIFVKLLPDGDPVQLTHDGSSKMSPVFDPAGTRIVYTARSEGNGRGSTWSVPVLGGEPTHLLANAEALTFVEPSAGSPRVLFSEYGKGVHLSVMTSEQNRSQARTVYAPANPGGMAHRSYLSPDHKQVLVVEMDGGWLPCRLAPYDGSSAGRTVGPSPAQCTTAAWSPDGKWMYFSANEGNGYHIWRQKFPDGAPEQVTFGASEEEGIAFAPDGRSFVTSVGTRQSTLWLHDARGERQITSQGYATLPTFSADGEKLFYLVRSRANRRFVSGELWAARLDTLRHERLLPEFMLEHYDVSTDGNQIVFAAIDNTGRSPVWLAALDGHTAPRQLSSIDAFRTFFGVNGDVYFLGTENKTQKSIYRVRQDGQGLQKAIPNPVGYFYDISPDGKFLAVFEGTIARIYPADGGPPTDVCAICGAAGNENRGITPPAVSWSPDGKFLYLNVREANQIFAIALEPGQSLPRLPVSGIRSRAEAAALPRARVISEARAFAGANPSVYVFPRVTAQRNIYRIPVP